MRVVWTPEAEADRRHAVDYIAEDNPVAALRMDQFISDAAAALASFPTRGRPGRIDGTRELVCHENYLIVYEVEDDTVWLLALVHCARQWPPA